MRPGLESGTPALARALACYRTRRCRSDEVEQITRLGQAALGPSGHPGVEVLRARLDRSPSCASIVEHRQEGAARLAGYHVIYPLTRAACREILAGRLARGSDLRPEHLTRRSSETGGLYIGMVYGTPTGLDRAAAVHSARAAIANAFRESPKLGIVFARAATAPGRRLIAQMGGRLIDAERSEVWRLDAPV